MNNNKNEKPKINMVGAGLAIGVGVGLAIGSAIGDTSTGLAIGIALGLGSGAILENKKRRKEMMNNPKLEIL